MNLSHDFELPGGYVRPDLVPYLNLLWYKCRVRTVVLLQPQQGRFLHATAEGIPDPECKVETVRNDTAIGEYIIRSTGEGEYLELGLKVIWQFNAIGTSCDLYSAARPPICLGGPPAAMIARCTACNYTRRPVTTTNKDGREQVVRLAPNGPIVLEYAKAGGAVWSTHPEINCPGRPR